jgi:hypothetical protein
MSHSDTPDHTTTDPSETSPRAQAPRVQRIIGVYAAEGTRRGEVSYWIGARLGRTHCALCDITHGTFREKAAWRTCRDSVPVPVEMYHRDDQPEAVRSATGGVDPVVVAETDGGVVVLLGPDAVAACDASPDALVDAIGAAVETAGLRWI